MLAALVAAAAGGAGCNDRPDVLVLFADTLRYDRVGCADTVGSVPSLEQFTMEGTCFERVASTSGWTLPTQTSMLLSTYPEEHGITNRNSRLDGTLPGITGPLQDAGYRAALFSGNVLTSYPRFQTYFDTFWVVDRDLEFAPDVDSYVVDEALRWLEEDAPSRPLFVMLQLFGPHFPYCAPGVTDGTVDVEGVDGGVIDLCDAEDISLLQDAELIDPFPADLSRRIEALYDQEVAFTDGEFQRFLDGWEALGRRRDRTTVVVTDHGEAFGEHGRVGHGRSLNWESSDCHMAFQGPGIPRQVVDRPVELLDLAPTLLSLLDLDAPDTWRGMDLSPLFRDPAHPFTARAYQVSELTSSVHRAVTVEGDDGHRYRLLAWDDEGIRQLYDATADPAETVDLYDDPAVATQQDELEVLLDEMIATAASGGPPR